MSTSAGLASGDNPSWALTFWNKFHRYRCLVTKYWWVLVLTLSISLCVAAYYQMNRPVAFESNAQLRLNVDAHPTVATDQGGSAYQEELDAMMKDEIFIMSGNSKVHQNAMDFLQARYPELRESPVALDFTPHNTILNITATGANAQYTERYLEATIEGYLNYRKQSREAFGDKTGKNLRDEIQRMEDLLKKDNETIIHFQRDHNVVFDKTDTSSDDLGVLRKQRETLQGEYDQLLLMTPEQGMDRTAAPNGNGATVASAPRDVSPTAQVALDLANTQVEYRQALEQIADLKSQLAEFSQDLRDKHPRIIAFKSAIEQQQRRVSDALDFARKRIESLRAVAKLRLDKLDEQIKQAAPEALVKSQLRSEFDMLTETKERDEKTYASDQEALSHNNTSKIDQDPMGTLEPASPATTVAVPWAKTLLMALFVGAAAGIGILLAIDRMDDRMGSISDFQMHFSEHVLGQIPRDSSQDSLELLRPDDQRHQLVESFRNLRSTLLFMPQDGVRPKTLLVTSAVPNEGKSTTSSNLALVLAFAGMKTLLIDADLRRGAIHQAFGVPRDPGLTDVLGHNVNWKLAIRTTGIENLHILPRGRNVPQPSEYLLNKATDRLLQELYPLYDYIVIDSSPVLAADDTASLAPKIDATLFVTRMSFTSAKMTRKSLEILYKRQANIPGVILNQVDTSSPEFVYYQYEEYYHTATDDDELPPDKTKKRVKPVAKVSS